MQTLLDAVVDLVALVSPAKVRTVSSALRGIANPGAAPNANTLAELHDLQQPSAPGAHD